MSNTNQTKTTTITERRIKSSKWLHFICSLVALLSDIAVLAVLLINVTDPFYWICPMIIAIADAVFLIKIIFSNYRFRYAFRSVITHIVILLCICAAALLFTGFISDRIVFDSIYLYAMPAVHLVQCFAVLFTALYASSRGKTHRRNLTIVVTLVFAACVGLYGNLLFTRGFFGQGFGQTNRTVIYSLDEDKNEYVAEGVLKGWGKNVVIPAEFNGLPVGAVNCELFNDLSVNSVYLDCNTDVRFENATAVLEARDDLKILSSKDKMDAFRESLYSLVREKAEAIYLANSVFPDHVASGEVYVTFRYSNDALKIAGDDIIPTWFATKGAELDLNEHASEIPYVLHSDALSDADLYFSYANYQGMMFRRAVNSKGASVNGEIQLSSGEVTVEFEKIYRVSIAEDNDEKYTIGEEYRFLKLDGEEIPYKLALAENVKSIADALPMRGGFDFEWLAGTDKHALGNIEAELSAIDAANGDCLYLYPVWQLKMPSITTLTADGVTENHSAIYGNNVELYSTAEAPDPSISLKYEWSNQAVIANSNIHTISNIHPEDAGDYTLTVTAYSDTVTSLTSSVSQTISVGFEKKELNFSWILPESMVYSAFDKPITAEQEAADVINNDVITFKLTQDSVKNAGVYNIGLSLTGDADTKYRVPKADANTSVTITPYPLDVDWSEETSFVYCGIPMLPDASATGLGNDGMLNLTITGEQKDVGKYSALAQTDNTNYELQKSTVTFHITPRPISIVSWNTVSMVYNGTSQNIKVTEVSNAVEGEESLIITGLTYLGDGTNVGSYTSKAVLPVKTNYMFEGDDTMTYQITPKALKIDITDKTTVYSGTVFNGFEFTHDGLAKTDSIEEVLSVKYTGAAVTAINASSQSYVISAELIGNKKYGNYAVEVNDGALTINKKPLNITLNSVEKTYDGKVYPYGNFDFTYDGVVSTDSLDEICNVTIIGTAVNAINASDISYTIAAEYDNLEKGENYKIEIVPATLKINKAPLTVNAIGGNKIYDGLAGGNFDIKAVGLVNGETVELFGTPNFGGEATTNKNAGVHTLTVSFYHNVAIDNYEVTYIDGAFEIIPKKITVTAIGGTKVYNADIGTDDRFDFTADELVSTDNTGMFGSPIYGGAAVNAKDVGEYTLSVRFEDNAATRNYSISYIDGKWEITPKSVYVTASSIDKVYNAQMGGAFDFEVKGLEGRDDKRVLGVATYKGDATEAINVGSYTVEVELSGNKNYVIESYTPGVFRITQKQVTVYPYGETRTYDGSMGGEFKFRVEGMEGYDSVDIFGKDTYSGDALTAKNAGVYSVGVSLEYDADIKNYTLKYETGSFEILKKALTVTAVGSNKTYDGTVVSGFDFIAEGLTNNETQSMLGTPAYSGEATTNKNVGTHTLTLSLPANSVTNNYNIKYVDTTCTITQKKLTVTAYATDRTYDGTSNGVFTFEMDGLASGDLKQNFGTPIYSGTASNAVNAGTYTLTVGFNSSQLLSNYDITYISDDDYVISKKNLTVSANAVDRIYDGTANGSFSVIADGLVSKDSIEKLGPFTYGDGANAVNAGTYTVTVSVADNTVSANYNISYASDTNYTISRRQMTVYAVAEDRVYDATANGEFSIRAEGIADADSISDFGAPIYGGSATKDAVKAGTYILTVEFNDVPILSNYDVSYKSDEYVISKRQLKVTASAEDKEYDGTYAGSFSYTIDGLLDIEPIDFGDPVYGGDAVGASDAGTYTLTVKLNESNMPSDYQITYIDDQYTISKKTLVITAIATDREYDKTSNSSFDFKAEGFVAGERREHLGTPEYSEGALNAVNAGTYTLSVSFTNSEILKNYNVTYVNDDFVISKRHLTVTAHATDREYDGTSNASFKCTMDGLAEGDSIGDFGTAIYGGSATKDAVKAGTYTLTVKFGTSAVRSNYEIEYVDDEYVISKKDLTVTAIAADRAYDGTADSEFGFKMEGLAATDTEDMFGTPSYGGTAVGAIEAGTYTLTVEFSDSAVSANYNIHYNSDDFVISE